MTTREKFRPILGAALPFGVKSAAVPISAAKSASIPLDWIGVSGGFRESHDRNNFQSSHPDMGITSNPLNFNRITFSNRHTVACLQIHVAHPALRDEAFCCQGQGCQVAGSKSRFAPPHFKSEFVSEEKVKGEEKALARRSLGGGG